MNVRLPLLVGVIISTAGAASPVLHAERPLPATQATTAAGGGVTLTEAEKNGKKMYQQRCSICHTQITPPAPAYGGLLTSDNVQEGRETFARQLITEGSARMPGFQYTLEPREIENILLYLKKVPGKSSVTGN